MAIKALYRRMKFVAPTVSKSYSSSLKSWKEIPGPSSLPLIGTLHHYLPGGLCYKFDGYDLSSKLFETYGTIVRLDAVIGRKPTVLLYDPELSSQVLRSENTLPIRNGFESLAYYKHNLTKHLNPEQPTGLLTEHLERWKQLRSTVSPIFLQPKGIKLFASEFDEVALEMVKRIKSLRDKNGAIKKGFKEETTLWALEALCVVGLGWRLGALRKNHKEDSPEIKLIHCALDLLNIVEKLDFSPSAWTWIASPNYRKAMNIYENQETLSRFFINKAYDNLKTRERSEDEKPVLQKLMEINEDYAVAMATDMLFAGLDTVSNLFDSTLYLLAKNPEKQNMLREELRSRDEKRPYLKACFKESVRMLPVISSTRRLTSKEHNIAGYQIPSNVIVACRSHDTSMMDIHYPRSKEFLPERWLVDKEDPLSYKNAHPFTYLPFGFGVRACIGRRIAELEIETLLSRVVENFHVSWSGPPPKVEERTINHFVEPFYFIFNDAPK